MELTDLLNTLLAMGGVMALITAAMNLAKRLGWITSGELAGKWNSGLQLLFFVGLWVAKTFFPEFDLAYADEFAQSLADLGVAVYGLLPFFLKGAGQLHDNVLKPNSLLSSTVGFSYS